MSIGIQACDIVLPGYVLSERIGSGGYAEVWRAEAPGGIQKAVKIVYGYYNDGLRVTTPRGDHSTWHGQIQVDANRFAA